MKECDNSKIHISSNFILSISLLIMFTVIKPEDGIEKIYRNVISFLQYYTASLTKRAMKSVSQWRKP